MKKLNSLPVWILLAFFLIIGNNAYSQDDDDVMIGPDEIDKKGSHYYNHADKNKVNFEVSLWGYVASPGKYLIPEGTTILDLITLGGGPSVESKLDDIRIVRLKNDTLGIKEDKIIIVDYDDFLWEDQITNPNKKNPMLMPGDVILIPGGPRYFFRDNLAIILSISSALISLAILILNIAKD